MICNYDTTASDSRRCERCNSCMSGLLVLVGIIAGIVFAAAGILLFIFSLITDLFPAVLTALITGIVLLITILFASFASEQGSRLRYCISCNLGGIFAGIIGTILSSLLAISADLTAITVTSGILVGLTFFFFAYMIISVLFIVLCIVRER